MKRYVIKNCPSHFNNVQMLEFSEGDCNSDKVTETYCKDNTDCLMKRIVEICKKGINSKDCYSRMYGGMFYCKPILELLEIEECE